MNQDPKRGHCFVKKNIITPLFNHLSNGDWNYVYEPAEDTFLLLDALENDIDFINFSQPSIVVEVGSGSGCIITALSQVLNTSSHCLAIDINPHACRITKATSSQNSTNVEVIQADLTFCLKDFSVDMIVFNPPYVVTPSSEVSESDSLTKSWAGGICGREVIDKFIDNFARVLNKKSFGYLVLIKENLPNEVMENLKKKQFSCEIIAKRKVRSEELFVVKFVKMF